MASPSSQLATRRLWTCCACHTTAISMALGDCPNCQASRCIDCDVKSQQHTELGFETPGTPKGTEMAKGGGSGVAAGEDSYGSSSTPTLAGPTQEFAQTRSQDMGHPESPAASFISPNFIDIVPDRHSLAVFVLNESSDARLISMWQSMLPRLSRQCLEIDLEETRLVSMHFVRLGIDESTSKPSIIINTTGPLSQTPRAAMVNAIRQEMTFFGIKSGFYSIQVAFRRSLLRRSMDTGFLNIQLPPICEPRNRYYHGVPRTGDSIGIEGSFVDTTTFGCWLVVGHEIMALTVDHIVPSPACDFSELRLTHLSEGDRHDLLVPILNQHLLELCACEEHICIGCPLREPCLNDRLSCFSSAIIHLEAATSSECYVSKTIRTKWLNGEFGNIRASYVGEAAFRSGRQFRFTRHLQRMEMDWSLFRTGQAHTSDVPFLRTVKCGIVESEPLKVAGIRPGALVKSIGRTSGLSMGQINTTQSIVFHEAYITLEWCVVKRPETNAQEWVKGGIGVQGDSGALIVNEETDEVYGMLWGRDGEGSTTFTIFTPMEEIIDDIKYRTQKHVAFLDGQTMPRNARTSDTDTLGKAPWNSPLAYSTREETGESSSSAMMSIPDLIAFQDGQQQEQEQEQEQGRRLPFPRYQGDDIPSQLDSKQVLGTYTYSRHLLGDEDE